MFTGTLPLKFHQNRVSNSWDIADIEFVWGGWVGCAQSFYCQTQPCVEVRLGFWQFSKKYWCTNTDTNYSDYGSNPYSLPLHTHLQFQSLSATSIHFHRPSSIIKTTSSKLFLVCKIKYQKNIWVQRNFIPIKSLGQRKFGMQKSFWWEKFRP